MYQSIAALRAFAALWVLVAHCMIWGGWRGPIPDPKLAVDLFMLISGFIMVANAEVKLDARRFWMRRVFRIVPTYYLALLVSVLLLPLTVEGFSVLRELNPDRWQFDTLYDPRNVQFTAENLLLHITFVFGLMPQWVNSSLLPDWSLSLEMQFYLAFPLLFAVGNRWALLLIALLAWWIGTLIHMPEPSFLPLKLHVFVAGMLAFRARTATDCVIVVALALLDSRTAAVMVAGLLVLVHFESLGRLPSWFAGRVLAFGSNASYAVYLFHGFFIAAFGVLAAQSFSNVRVRVGLMVVFVLIASYATAWVIHRFVERPGIELGRRLMAGTPVLARR